jgi:hypothetical protein
MLTIHGQHHQKADIDRLYVPRKDGGRGLMQIEGAYITKVIKFKEYVKYTEGPLMQIVRTHQHNTSSTLFHTATNLHKSLQSNTKQIKTHNSQEPEGNMGSKTTAWTVSTERG